MERVIEALSLTKDYDFCVVDNINFNFEFEEDEAGFPGQKGAGKNNHN